MLTIDPHDENEGDDSDNDQLLIDFSSDAPGNGLGSLPKQVTDMKNILGYLN